MKIFLLVILLFTCGFIKAEEITIYFYDRPPFYYTAASGEPAGILVDKVRKLESSNYKIVLRVFPPKRQLIAIEAKNKNICGLGWFKTKRREEIGVFSSMVFTDEPMGLVIHKDFGDVGKISVEEIFKNRKFEFLKKNSFKYSDSIEKFESDLNPQTYTVSSSISQMIDMISLRERYYTFIDKVEANYYFSTKPNLKDKILYIPIKEGQKGNARFLYCSKNIPSEFAKLIKSFSF